MQPIPLSENLAERALSISSCALTVPMIEAAKVAISDTIGVTLLGATSDTALIARGTVSTTSDDTGASILATHYRANPIDTAFANGVAGHALDYDDFTEILGGHPSVPLLPAIMATAEVEQSSGLDLILAYVVGVEIETRIARGVHFHHYEKGWHPTSTLGIFGATAGCARLMHLDAPTTAQAIAIAASNASGIKANFGTMTKPLHIGQCARNGVLAATLAARGFTANPRAFEAPQGFLNVYNGPGNYSIAAMLDRWFAPALVEEPGISLKQFPCCGSIHPAISAALQLHHRHDLHATQIQDIEILTHPRRLPHTNNPDPHTALESKFSIQYCVARALIDGAVTLAHFENSAWRAKTIIRLLDLTRVGVHPDMAPRESATFGAEVVVRLDSGERLQARVDNEPGRGPANPMSKSERYAKFQDCASRALPTKQISPLFNAIESLERAQPINKVIQLARHL